MTSSAATALAASPAAAAVAGTPATLVPGAHHVATPSFLRGLGVGLALVTPFWLAVAFLLVRLF